MKKLDHLVKDYVYCASHGIAMHFRRNPPAHYLEHVVPGKAPVIILPGIFSRWAFCKPIADQLSLLGHPVYIVPALGINIKDIPTSARKVKEIIEENKLKNTVIVAHSKGGLIGKYLLVHENAENCITGLIAIASPFHGSALAKYVKLPGTRELSPDSEMIKYLEDHKEVNQRIVSIIPSYDNIVLHEKGSCLEGALQNINVDCVGHHKIVGDKAVLENVVLWTEKLSNSLQQFDA